MSTSSGELLPRGTLSGTLTPDLPNSRARISSEYCPASGRFRVYVPSASIVPALRPTGLEPSPSTRARIASWPRLMVAWRSRWVRRAGYRPPGQAMCWRGWRLGGWR